MLARYCDLLFTFHLHRYGEARRRLLRGILQKGRSACDLACGTGERQQLEARGRIASEQVIDERHHRGTLACVGACEDARVLVRVR